MCSGLLLLILLLLPLLLLLLLPLVLLLLLLLLLLFLLPIAAAATVAAGVVAAPAATATAVSRACFVACQAREETDFLQEPTPIQHGRKHSSSSLGAKAPPHPVDSRHFIFPLVGLFASYIFVHLLVPIS